MSQERNPFVPISVRLGLSIITPNGSVPQLLVIIIIINVMILFTALIFVVNILHALWSLLLSIDPAFTTERQTFFSFLYNSFIRNIILCNIYQEENTELFTKITLYSLIRAATATH